MADIKKPNTSETKPAITTPTTTPASQAAKTANAKPTTPAKPAAKRGRKPAAKKATAKKSTAKTTTDDTKKTTTKNTTAKKATTAKKTATKKTATKNAAKKITKADKPAKNASRKPKVELDSTDVVKTALWKSISKTKSKKIKDFIAIQVYAEGLESFFIAIQDGQPKIDRAYYHGHNGDLQASEKELLKIAAGKYDIIKSVKSGAINFNGRLSVLLQIMDLF